MLLQQALAHKTIEGRTFGPETLSTDGYRFVNCRFEQTRLEYAGGLPPIFEGCALVDVNWNFVGPAGNMIAFLQMVSNTFGEGGQEMIETINEIIRGERVAAAPTPATFADLAAHPPRARR